MQVPALEVTIAGRIVSSETLLEPVGAHVVVVTTTLPHHGVTVVSTYVGHSGATTRIVHLAAAAAAPASTSTAVASSAAIPVTHAHDRCLADHVMRLIDVMPRLLPAGTDCHVRLASPTHADAVPSR